MANNSVGFKLTSNGKTILDIPKSESTADRLYDILGGQASSLVELRSPKIDEDVPGTEQWIGWISTPDITRGKGDEVYVLINDRPVASGPFHQAIRRGYKTRLMQGRHPIAVLSLDVPASDIIDFDSYQLLTPPAITTKVLKQYENWLNYIGRKIFLNEIKKS